MKKINSTTVKAFQKSNMHAMVKSVEIKDLYSLRKDTGEMFRKAKAIIWLKTDSPKPVTATMYFNLPLALRCNALENYITSSLCFYNPSDFKSGKEYLQAVFDGTCTLIEDYARVA